MAIDRSRLIKLMMMTQSSSDGEALVAVRKANALLKTNGMNWDNFLGITKPTVMPRTPRPPPKPSGRGTTDTHPGFHRFTDPKITNMLASLLRDSKGGFRDFVESVSDAWHNKGYLTERQYEAVINAYERAK